MSQLQAGIRSIIPLSSSIPTGSTWDRQAIVCVSICAHILDDGQDLRWLNPVALGSVLTESGKRADQLQCPKAQNIAEILEEMKIKNLCVASWTSQNKKTLDSYIAEVSLDRYAKMNTVIISMGASLMVLVANSERIYIIDPHPRNPMNGEPPSNRYSQGVVVEISNFFGIGNYLHNYDGATEYTASTIVRFDPQPSIPEKDKKEEEVEMDTINVEGQEEDQDQEMPAPSPPSVEEEEEPSSKRQISDMEKVEVEAEEPEVDNMPVVKKKKRAIGISKRRKSTRGGKKTTRGTGGDVIVIDEAAHVPEDLFYETIVPILELKNTSLLCISTPMDDFNFYSRLLDKKDEEGVPLFNTIRAGRVCDDCKKLDYEEMIMCDHVAQTAHWKSVASHKRVRLLYDGDEARGVRETKGIVASSFTPCFEKKLIVSCFSLPRFVTEAPPSHIYLTADPTGGGPSDLALASGYLDGATLVVTGLESQKARNHAEEKSLIMRHIARLRELYPGVHIWFIPENNLGLEGSHMEKMVRRVPNLDTYYEQEGKRAGVRKSGLNTSDYQIRMEDMLIKKDVRFSTNLFTVSKGQTVKTIFTEMQSQFERYHWEVESIGDPSKGNFKTTMTGKMGGAQDDMYIAMAMLGYWPKRIRTEVGR